MLLMADLPFQIEHFFVRMCKKTMLGLVQEHQRYSDESSESDFEITTETHTREGQCDENFSRRPARHSIGGTDADKEGCSNGHLVNSLKPLPVHLLIIRALPCPERANKSLAIMMESGGVSGAIIARQSDHKFRQ
jgi:hypothetical protein